MFMEKNCAFMQMENQYVIFYGEAVFLYDNGASVWDQQCFSYANRALECYILMEHQCVIFLWTINMLHSYGAPVCLFSNGEVECYILM